ncbi:MAG: GGDEF domain-containing phosphodiesterase [Lachnospiraceae bacterium]|nr:GGDEF domain-containing phosphodiesterase [Lachnospiraceae bacterium]
MLDELSVMVAFLIFEAIFCFMAAVCMLRNTSVDPVRRRLITVLNFLAGLLLTNDFFAYAFRGRQGTINYIMVRLSNGLVFTFTGLIIFVYTMTISYELFGSFGIRSKTRAVIRTRICYLLVAVDVALIIINQFNSMYYGFNKNNLYVKGPLYIYCIAVPYVGVFLVFTVLIQYRKKLSRTKFVVFSLYIVLPAVAFAFQIHLYGKSYLNVAIGLSMIVLFIECMIAQSKEVLRMARTEVRTGLLNEHGCIEQLDQMRNKKELLEYAVVFTDLRKFSDINRKYGTEAGNEVMSGFAEIIKEHLGVDGFIGRQASDLFIIAVRKKKLDEIIKLLDCVHVKIGSDNPGGKKTEVTVSGVAGIFEIDDENLNGEDIIAYAFQALSYAKTVTKKPVVYMTRELKSTIEEKKLYEARIPNAFANEEFVPFYQPKVDLKKNRMCGAEALARWTHNGVTVSPGRFVPIMESNDTICRLDFYILNKVCTDIKEWIEKGLDPVAVSVNFSRRNLSNPRLADDIDKVIGSYNIPKKLIEIEITETNDEFPISVLKTFVQKMHTLGYRTAIDDFGCGSSSLSVLREIPFDILKIDKGFVDNPYAKDITILSHIIKMAKAISLEVIAEGVEEKEQVDTLRSLGADIIQGYYYDKPMPREEMCSRLENNIYDK